MTTQLTPDTAVRRTITVNAPIEHAFAVFTEGIDRWWPRAHTIGKEPLAEMVLELHAGGRAYGIGVSGEQSDWGRVLAYEPPTRVLVSWDISLAWSRESDPARTSEFEVRFTPDGPQRTLVELEHRHLDLHGEGWERMRDAVGAPPGWGAGLEAFAAAAQA